MLRAEIGKRASNNCAAGITRPIVLRRQIEVEQQRFSIIRQQDIGGLEVSMHNTSLMSRRPIRRQCET